MDVTCFKSKDRILSLIANQNASYIVELNTGESVNMNDEERKNKHIRDGYQVQQKNEKQKGLWKGKIGNCVSHHCLKVGAEGLDRQGWRRQQAAFVPLGYQVFFSFLLHLLYLLCSCFKNRCMIYLPPILNLKKGTVKVIVLLIPSQSSNCRINIFSRRMKATQWFTFHQYSLAQAFHQGT